MITAMWMLSHLLGGALRKHHEGVTAKLMQSVLLSGQLMLVFCAVSDRICRKHQISVPMKND